MQASGSPEAEPSGRLQTRTKALPRQEAVTPALTRVGRNEAVPPGVRRGPRGHRLPIPSARRQTAEAEDHGEDGRRRPPGVDPEILASMSGPSGGTINALCRGAWRVPGADAGMSVGTQRRYSAPIRDVDRGACSSVG